MELLDRYLQAVRKYVPKNRRDVVEELRADILEQVEDKEGELGRPLTLEEEEALFKQLGHPIVVAGRYLPKQYLIGPTVFPLYWFALRAGIPMVLLAYLVLNALTFITQPVTGSRVIGILLGFPGVAVTVAVWATAVFAVIEWAQAKYIKKNLLCDWSPRKLPAVEPGNEYRRSHTIFEVIASGIMLLWLLAVPSSPYLWLGPGAVVLQYVKPTPVWHTYYWAFVAVLFAQWLIEFTGLFHASVRRVRPLLGLVGRGATLAIMCLLLRANRFVELTDAGRANPSYQNLVESVNFGLLLALKVGAIFFALQLVWDSGRMIFRRYHGQPVVMDGKCVGNKG